MVVKKKKILTSGVDSEYVLDGLSQFLRHRGYDITELDFGHFHEDPYSLLHSLREKDVIYITSAHVPLTARTAITASPSFIDLYPKYLGPVEIISVLKPKLSIYIPHDLLDPYGAESSELRFLDIFDHVLAVKNPELLRAVFPRTTQVHNAGWIKYTDEAKEEFSSYKNKKNLLFITMFQYLFVKHGVDGLVRHFLPLLTDNTYVKLPAWKGADLMENALRETGKGHIIPSHLNSTELIKDAKVVVCNGASSIHIESSLLGRPTICLLDNEGISPLEQKKKLKSFPNIYFHDYSERQPIPNELLQQVAKMATPPLIQPFQYALVEKIIEES